MRELLRHHFECEPGFCRVSALDKRHGVSPATPFRRRASHLTAKMVYSVFRLGFLNIIQQKQHYTAAGNASILLIRSHETACALSTAAVKTSNARLTTPRMIQLPR